MFLDLPAPPVERPRFAEKYEDRLRQMCRQRRRIAYLTETPEPGTFRYRGVNPGLALEASPQLGVSGAWFTLAEFVKDDTFIEACDVLVVVRARYDAQVATAVQRARALRKLIVFDCDDLIFDTRYVHLLIRSIGRDETLASEWDRWFAIFARKAASMALCDRFLTTNDFLAEKAKAYAPTMPRAVSPNFLHPEQQAYSEELYRAKRANGFKRSRQIHLGYFSGSPTHALDFAVAGPAIARLMDKDSRIRLHVVGPLDLGWDFNRHRHSIHRHEFQDWVTLQKLIAEVEINLAPLQDNDFTNCKSNLKYFEAAIVGTPTVATPTFTFAEAIRDGENGMLARATQWDAALERAVALVDDTEAYVAMSDAAFHQAKEEYGFDRQAERIIKTVFG